MAINDSWDWRRNRGMGGWGRSEKFECRWTFDGINLNHIIQTY